MTVLVGQFMFIWVFAVIQIGMFIAVCILASNYRGYRREYHDLQYRVVRMESQTDAVTDAIGSLRRELSGR